MQALNASKVAPQMAQIKQMIAMLKGANNPQEMVNNMIQQNPQVSKIIQQYGSPEKAFRGVAEQMGLNADEIINMFQ